MKNFDFDLTTKMKSLVTDTVYGLMEDKIQNIDVSKKTSSFNWSYTSRKISGKTAKTLQLAALMGIQIAKGATKAHLNFDYKSNETLNKKNFEFSQKYKSLQQKYGDNFYPENLTYDDQLSFTRNMMEAPMVQEKMQTWLNDFMEKSPEAIKTIKEISDYTSQKILSLDESLESFIENQIKSELKEYKKSRPREEI